MHKILNSKSCVRSVFLIFSIFIVQTHEAKVTSQFNELRQKIDVEPNVDLADLLMARESKNILFTKVYLYQIVVIIF